VLATSTVDVPKGSLSSATELRRIGANSQLFGAKAFENLVVGASPTGAIVRLHDVADVVDSVENERVAGWTDTTRAVLIIVRRQPGANIVEVNDRIKKLLPTLATSISPAIKTTIALDRTQTIRASVLDVEKTLVISIFLVVVVVFVFLRSGPATAIPSVAVARGHLRRDVSAGLQPEQPLAHGADHRDWLRGRRRDRRHREHHAPHRAREDAR
jgi:multidrug efflux pump